MTQEERDSIIIKRLVGGVPMESKEVCDCDSPAPYKPLGLCAPMYPINHCLVCGGFVKREVDL